MVFVEHYVEEIDTRFHRHQEPEEHWDLVTFPLNADGTLHLREDRPAGTFTTVIGTPDDYASSTDERLTQDLAFGEPSWKYLAPKPWRD